MGRREYGRPVRFGVLGPLEVSREDGPVPLGGPKQRIVLAHLMLGANKVVSAEHLIDALWGEELPEDPKSTLQVYVSRLRSALGADAVEAQAPGYVLRAARDEVDAPPGSPPERCDPIGPGGAARSPGRARARDRARDRQRREGSILRPARAGRGRPHCAPGGCIEHDRARPARSATPTRGCGRSSRPTQPTSSDARRSRNDCSDVSKMINPALGSSPSWDLRVRGSPRWSEPAWCRRSVAARCPAPNAGT